jgi:hypothetical protein
MEFGIPTFLQIEKALKFMSIEVASETIEYLWDVDEHTDKISEYSHIALAPRRQTKCRNRVLSIMPGDIAVINIVMAYLDDIYLFKCYNRCCERIFKIFDTPMPCVMHQSNKWCKGKKHT